MNRSLGTQASGLNRAVPQQIQEFECASVDSDMRLMVRAIEDESQLLGFAQNILARLVEIADRQLGPCPTAAGKDVEGTPSGDVYTLLAFQGMTRQILREVEDQINRLSRL